MNESNAQVLAIVAREVAATLNDARLALEAGAERLGDPEPLHRVVELTALARGVLEVTGVHGGALLAHEASEVARWLLVQGADKPVNPALDALMRAVVQLPAYVERVLGGGRDLPIVLLPLLNDLRAVRGVALMSEGTVLTLNLSSDVGPPPAPPGMTQPDAASWARRLRPQFQLSLLGWIKGEKPEQNLAVLTRVAQALEASMTTRPAYQLWWIVAAVFEAIGQGGLVASPTIKRLLGQCDRELKRLFEQGEAQYSAAPPNELANNLLYSLARATSSGPRLKAVAKAFGLAEALPLEDALELERESLSTPSLKLMQTVAAAIKEDLGRVKDALDIFTRKGGAPEELAPQVELLKKIGDTLAVLGLAAQRDRVHGELLRLADIASRRAPPVTDSLVDSAAVLIGIEDALDDDLVALVLPPAAQAPVIEGGEFHAVAAAVLRECLVELARVKEAVTQALPPALDPIGLDAVPQLLRGISAALSMLNRVEAVEVVDALSHAITDTLNHVAQLPGQQSLDNLADAVIGIEYYLETLVGSRQEPLHLLDAARSSLASLAGPPVAGTTPVAASPAALPEAVPAVAPPEPLPATPAAAPAPAPALVLAEGVDAELLAIFIEEAREEIARIGQLFPLWADNEADRESLIRVRRSFHTLKGSGRMVGAQKMGDLAWSIENLLNRVIDGTRTRTAGMLVLLAEAIAALPGIVDELEFGRPFEAALEPVMARAAAYAEGRAEEQPPPIAAPAPALPKGYEPTQLIRVLDVSAMAEPVPPIAVVPEAEPIVETAAPEAAAEPQPIGEAESQLEPEPEPEQELVAFEALFEEPASLAAPEPERVAEPPAVVEPEAVAELAPVPEPESEPEPTPEPVAVEEEEPSEAMAMDISLQDIFRKEVESHLETLRQYLRNAWISPGPHLVSESLYRACHTLRGASRTANSVPSITLAEPLHRWVMRLFDHDFGFDENGLAALADCVARFEDIIEDGDEPRRYERTLAALIARIEELDDGVRRHVTDAAAAAAAVAAMPSGDTGIVPVLVQPEPEPAPAPELVLEPGPEPEPVLEPQAEPVLPPLESISELVAEAAAAEDFIDLTGLEQFEQAALPDVPGVLVEAAGPISVDLSLLEYRPEPVVQPPQPEPEQAVEPTAEPSIEPAAEAVAEAPFEAPAEETVEAAPEPEPEVEPEPTFAAPTFADFLLPGESDVEPALTDALGLNFTGTITLPAALAEDALAGGPELEPEPVAAPVPEPAPAPPPAAAEAAELAEEPPLDEEFDAEIAAIFCEEATELLEVADGALGALRRDSGSRDRVVELQRALHTLKGGARMAGIRAMGDLSHEVESLLIQAGAGVAALDAETFEAVQASLDELARMRDLAAEGRASRPASELMARIRRASHLGAMEPVEAPPATVAPLEPVAAPVPVVVEPIVEAPAVPEPAAVAPAPEPPLDVGLAVPTPEAEPEPEPEAPAEADAAQADAAEAGAAEAVPAAESAPASAAVLPGREAPAERAELARVDAELLDAMLNNAGEVSIVRARLEQQLSLIDFNLAELSRVVQRFKEQLRKLEIETEAQVLHRHVDSAPRREDFDPLELDRYSSIQQYSRALAETAADVGSVQNLLETLTREAQNLLTQQGRVVSDLQAGLMRTRMVPFQRHIQRLTRIVRQAAAEAGKRVDLVVQGAAGELDRQVLERMLPPFEHMLRNSVVHGLETPAEREAVGKPATGRIDMSVRRDGSEVVIVVADDGAGINLRAVREKAVLRGLLAPKQEISDEEAIHLILESGFSTAVSVTQSAGRGVGMDVVSNEVKKLGGALQIETWEGRGTRFTIRLPFTLAISQALVVRSGDELYALPLPTVEGVVRILKSEVERGLADESPAFEYNGQQYRFQHLGLFVGGEAAVLPEHDTPVPVVLVRAGEHSTAIVTDELLGSREIVVKSVGPMISGIRGISGATILGDGRICIILDIGALVRSEWRARALKAPDATRRDNRICVLVVDDSITVRRVTQRLLERNEMKVLTAKDGIDAIALLQEQIPDVILLDIEMPRMDGYEVALHIRNDPRLAHIPIVMITSRVGEKHRARAIELGVNEYLGKPYQETQLLEAIEPLVRRRGRQP